MDIDAEMLHLRRWSPDEVCSYLATKVRTIRKQARESQEEFALRAGIPLRTYKRFETHGKGSLETFVQVLRAIDRTHYLFMLFPQPGPLAVRPSLQQRLSRLRPTKFL